MLTEGSANAGIIASAISRQTHIITSEMARTDRRVEETAAAWRRAYDQLVVDYNQVHAKLQEVIRRHNLLADEYNDLDRHWLRMKYDRDEWKTKAEVSQGAFEQLLVEHKARVHELICRIAELHYQLPPPEPSAPSKDDPSGL